MQIAKARRGDVRGISICRKESIQTLRKFYSKEGLNILLLNSFEDYVLEEIFLEEVYCLLKNGEVIANISLSGSQISGLYVKPKFTGQGYGQKLLEFVENLCKSRGIFEINVYATLNAKKFYMHNGFIIDGEAYSFPFQNPIKFISMRKNLRHY